ncbi:MAG: copper amine oxidase N-terminal domain-containing protein, partial [bacterium]
MRRGAVVYLLAALVFGAVSSHSAVAQTVAVVVDGRVVGFDQPPVVSGGRLLVPLRGVFERLGAQVFWQPEAGRVVARRAATTVILHPGNRQASVNGRRMLLDSAPIMLQGRVLVPLRFVSEALGAGVNWDSASRVVYITSSRVGAAPPPAPAPAPAEPIRPPLRVPQPQPAPEVIEGTVVRVDTHTSPQRVHVLGNGVRSTIVVIPETSIFLTDSSTGRTAAAGIDQIRRGDHVRVTLDPHLQASVIRATYRELSGRLEGLSGRVVALGGQAFSLADDVVFTLDGREVTRDALARGMEVAVRINPQTGEVW